MVSEKTIGRLSLYRRLLYSFIADGKQNIFSHELAAIAGATAAQVRRDIMNIGYSGNPNRGYATHQLVISIANFLDAPRRQYVALMGVGNLGRAILTYFTGRRPKLSIVAAFDNDPRKFGRLIHGCYCYSTEKLSDVIGDKNISIGIITVPACEAQNVADSLVQAGVQGLLNFAPVPLKVPSSIYVDYIDMIMSLEKVAYYARNTLKGR